MSCMRFAATVKNTFVDIVELDTSGFRRSASEGDVSKSQSKKAARWEPMGRRFWPSGKPPSDSGERLDVKEARVDSIRGNVWKSPDFDAKEQVYTTSCAARVDRKQHGDAAPDDIALLVARVDKELGGTVPTQELLELAASGILAQIPRDANGCLASVGAILHDQGQCSPCPYWFKGVCKYSILCRRCHILHPNQSSKRLRPSKRSRLRQQRFAQKAFGSSSNFD